MVSGVNQERRTCSAAVLKKRTQRFALDVIHLVEGLPRGVTAQVLGKQLLRSATSVGANYRASCRAKSSADFLAKLGIVEEEADECQYWLELLIEAEVITQEQAAVLHDEAGELTAIIVSSIRTARRRKNYE
ncbi:MAG: four helix bundle protein [Armatimonadota bacterium]